MGPLKALGVLDVRAGTIVSVKPLAAARKAAYCLMVDFGEAIGTKQSGAQLTELYEPANLIGRQVLAAVNLPPKPFASIISEVLVLGVPDESGKVVLISADRPVPNGAKMF